VRVRGLDGREYPWALAGRSVAPGDTRKRSSGHLAARELLRELFPFDRLLEEVPAPGCPGSLYFDFVLPTRRLVVEVQGEQHRTFSPHFHGSRDKFLGQRRRDAAKAEWCELNGLTLVLLHDDRRDGWRDEVRGALRPREDGGG
jgi:hypothetical protein